MITKWNGVKSSLNCKSQAQVDKGCTTMKKKITENLVLPFKENRVLTISVLIGTCCMIDFDAKMMISPDDMMIMTV